MEYVIVVLSVFYMFWIYISNADLKVEKINSFLKPKELEYIRHRIIKKANKNFENGETFFILFIFIKKYYQIDATDSNGDPVNIDVERYQSTIPFMKNRVFFHLN